MPVLDSYRPGRTLSMTWITLRALGMSLAALWTPAPLTAGRALAQGSELPAGAASVIPENLAYDAARDRFLGGGDLGRDGLTELRRDGSIRPFAELGARAAGGALAGPGHDRAAGEPSRPGARGRRLGGGADRRAVPGVRRLVGIQNMATPSRVIALGPEGGDATDVRALEPVHVLRRALRCPL